MYSLATSVMVEAHIFSVAFHVCCIGTRYHECAIISMFIIVFLFSVFLGRDRLEIQMLDPTSDSPKAGDRFDN